MTLLTLVAILIVVGVLLWALPRLPIDAQIVGIIRVVVIVVLVLWLVASFAGEGHWNPRLW
jgi:hypothetical protein